MRKPYIYIIGASMLLAPTSMWAQAALSPRTAVALSNTNEQKAHHSKLKDQNVISKLV